MYLLINKTAGTTQRIIGGYPLNTVDALLDAGQDIIVISLYSNTVKIPTGTYDDLNGFREYHWKEYHWDGELNNTTPCAYCGDSFVISEGNGEFCCRTCELSLLEMMSDDEYDDDPNDDAHYYDPELDPSNYEDGHPY